MYNLKQTIKFQFNLSNQTLKLVKEDHFLVIPEGWKFFYFRSLGFILNPSQPEHRILFSVYQEKIQVFYRVPQEDKVVYYRREITRPTSGIAEIEFSEWDRVKKITHD